MRLFEVAGNQFQDDLANILKVLQGRANTKQAPSTVSWTVLNGMLSSQGYGEVNQDIVTKIKDKIGDDVIQDVTPEGIVLKTDVGTPEQDPSVSSNPRSGKSIDQMAHNVVSKGL
jgi:hypothetical protein